MATSSSEVISIEFYYIDDGYITKVIELPKNNAIGSKYQDLVNGLKQYLKLNEEKNFHIFAEGVEVSKESKIDSKVEKITIYYLDPLELSLTESIKEKAPKEGAKSTSLSISIPKQSLNLPLDEILKNKANIILHFGLHDDSYRDFIFNLK